MDPKIFEKTDADSYFDADYSCPGEPPVSLYIAHYESQSSPGGLGHNPVVCMTGSGWKMMESGSLAIAPGHAVNYLILARAGTSLIVYYWNIQMGDWMALENARMYKLYTIFNSLKRQRTDWALVRLITPIDQHIAKSHERLTDFAKLLIPVLPQFIKQ